MPVNDFEKQVQQKMDELQLHPSGQVWEEVEKQIRKDKKRRILFLWLPLLALLLGGATAWLLLNDGKQPEQTAVINKQENPSENNSPNNKIGSVPGSSDAAPGVTGQGSSTSAEEVAVTNNNKNTITTNSPSVVDKERTNASSGIGIYNYSTQPAQKGRRKAAEKADKTAVTETGVMNETVTGNTIQNEVNNIKQPTEPATPVETNKTTITPVPAQKDSTVVKDPAVVRTDSIIVVPEVAKQAPEKRNKWEWGFALQPGLSNTKRGDLFNTSKELYVATSNLSPGNSAIPFAPPVLIESPKEHFSFSVKLFGQRKLSKKLSLQAGAQYAYLSTKVKVGSLIHSQQQLSNDISSGVTIDQYYSAANGSRSTSYINKYHFAGLSAGLSWRVLSKKKFSLYWDNTIALNSLLSTNALLFDGNIRGYYNDDNAFNKTQVFVSTGLSVPLLQQKKFTLMGTAFVSYGLTPVLKKSSAMNSHLLNYGIGVKFIFHQLK